MRHKTNIDGYEKDEKSNLIVNTDLSKYKQIKTERQKNRMIENLQASVTQLQSELSMIKAHLGIN